MKRYVSLAGALLLGTVVATEKKAEFTKVAVQSAEPKVLATHTKTTEHKKKPVRRQDSSVHASSVTSHDVEVRDFNTSRSRHSFDA